MTDPKRHADSDDPFQWAANAAANAIAWDGDPIVAIATAAQDYAALAAMPAPPSPAELVELTDLRQRLKDRIEWRESNGQDRDTELMAEALDALEAVTPPDARAKVIEEAAADLFSRLLRWRDAEAAAAEARGEPMFMGKPDAWYEDTHWFCANGHVSARFLKSERGDLCLACQAPAFLGPKIGETAFALIRTRLRALSPSGQSGGGE